MDAAPKPLVDRLAQGVKSLLSVFFGSQPSVVEPVLEAGAPALSLRRLVYRSLACCETSEIEKIFCDSQSHNVESGITGILFVSGPRFYQCLEGEHDAVGLLYERIKRDTRHSLVELLDDRPCDSPLYPYWSMGALLGYESVIHAVVPLLDSGDGLQVRVGLEMLALSMAHQDARSAGGRQVERMIRSAPQAALIEQLAHNPGQSNSWLSLVAENMHLKAQLMRAEAGRREFFSAISHELRTPMSGMLGASDLLGHPRLNAAMLDRQRAALKSSSERFAKTLNDIFTLHRIESGDQECHPSPVNLHAHVQSACDAVAHQDVNISRQFSDAEGVHVEVDSALLQTVLNNLLVHAIDRSHNGQVEVMLHVLAAKEERLWWRCAIRDYGSHVSVERLLTLFQPFSAGLERGAGYNEDAGLELALAAAIVKLLDGRMGAHNESGGGMTVWFTFAAQRAEVDSVADFTAQPVLLADKSEPA